MPHYALRDPKGVIVSLHRHPVAGAQALAPDHPDVLAFLGQTESKAFAEKDAHLVRVLEDLVDALVRRNVLRITDLPAEAQAKLFDRKHFREHMQGSALNLFGAQAPGGGWSGVTDGGAFDAASERAVRERGKL